MAQGNQAPSRELGGITTGWPAIDDGHSPVFAFGVVHELLGVASPVAAAARARPWLPPLAMMVHLACCALEQANQHDAHCRSVLWVGRDCWPSPLMLAAHPRMQALLQASLFIDASTVDDRAWALDVALRSNAACAVLGDCSRFSSVLSRRMQLAAERGGGLCVLARPAWEEQELSAACTRWRVMHAARDADANADEPAWHMRMLRCKAHGAAQLQSLGSTHNNTQAKQCLLQLDQRRGALVQHKLNDNQFGTISRDQSRDGVGTAAASHRGVSHTARSA